MPRNRSDGESLDKENKNICRIMQKIQSCFGSMIVRLLRTRMGLKQSCIMAIKKFKTCSCQTFYRRNKSQYLFKAESLRSTRMVIILAEFDGLELCAVVICNILKHLPKEDV